MMCNEFGVVLEKSELDFSQHRRRLDKLEYGLQDALKTLHEREKQEIDPDDIDLYVYLSVSCMLLSVS